MSSELHRSQVILRTDLYEDLPTVRGDRVQLQQVILNLILNAADAMREVNDRPRNLLVATSHEDTSWVRLSVCDSGVGIDPQRSTPTNQLRQLYDGIKTMVQWSCSHPRVLIRVFDLAVKASFQMSAVEDKAKLASTSKL